VLLHSFGIIYSQSKAVAWINITTTKKKKNHFLWLNNEIIGQAGHGI